jgi:hypothetical protein
VACRVERDGALDVAPQLVAGEVDNQNVTASCVAVDLADPVSFQAVVAEQSVNAPQQPDQARTGTVVHSAGSAE